MARGPQQQGPKTRRGAIHAVGCPWCAKPMDLRPLQDMIETGFTIQCDHCNKHSQIKQMVPTTIVVLAPHTGSRKDPGRGDRI